MESPLSAVQLLWINLIMDTFAAFALSTEPPLPSVIQGPPCNARAQILTPVIWRQIIGISLWNTITFIPNLKLATVLGTFPYAYTY